MSNIFATCNIKNACKDATYIFVCVPTNFDCDGNGLDVSIVEYTINKSFLVNNLVQFKNQSQIIIANKCSPELSDVNYKVFTRDIFLRD